MGKKNKWEKSEKGPEWVGEEKDQFPGISHITSVAMAIALSVCTCSEQQLHLELHRQPISNFSFGSAGNKQQGCFLKKKVVCGGCDRERRRVCKYALAWSLLSPGCHLRVCVWHPAWPPPELQLELLDRAMVQISKKVWVREVRIQQSHLPACGGTAKSVSFMCSPTSRMGENVESQILSLVKHNLTHKLVITLIETWHRQESVGRVNHWKWHIYIAPLGIILWQLCFCATWS